MGEALTSAAFYEWAKEDSSMSLKAFHTPGDIHRLEVYETYPQTCADTYERRQALFDAAIEEGINPHEHPYDIISATVWPGALRDLSSATRFRSIIETLGYGYNVERDASGDEVSSKSVATYPSVERANRFMGLLQRAAGQETIRFAEYPGGDYEVHEFIEAFVQEGNVLMAAEQPYQAHDLTYHFLGWLGMYPELVESIRGHARAYAERAKAEEDLPQVPAINSHRHNQEKINDLLRPSRHVLRRITAGLDELTDRLPEETIFRPSECRTPLSGGDTDIVRDLAVSVNMFFRLELSRRPDSGFQPPHGLLGEASDWAVAGTRILERYKLAEQVSLEAGSDF